MTVSIRQLRNGDLRDVLAIEREIFPEDAWTEQMFADELGEPTTRYYIVAEADGTIAGYAGLRAGTGNRGDVQTIAVRADRQGEGIGTALLTDLIATAVARNCHEIFLDVRAENARARLFYRRNGFTEVGMRPGYYGPSADAIVMRLRFPRRRTTGKAATR